ncbi:MAG TPA: ATP-binding protein [Stellaceae bacterium]|nr:ATP-binding protein [Stellaceae bacterium]
MSGLLLAVLAGTSVLLTRELIRDSRALAEQARLVSLVRNANIASKHFGDLKYWLTDFAITLSARSQESAEVAKTQLDTALKSIAAVDPGAVAAVGREVDTLTGLARQAGDAYSSDDAVTGNKLMAEAQTHILSVDRELDQVVERLEQSALARRDAAIRDAEAAVTASIVAGGIVLLITLGLTALVVRSINRPLRQLEHAMAAVSRGDLEIDIPRAGHDEIGAMTRTLTMLRDSLIDRERLERERERAAVEIRAARDAAEMALGELKAAQANLIQSEKMASLGQLTAGIAHEIKNPLNFVNNFASLSVELLEEFKETAAPALASLDANKRAEIDEAIDMLAGNLQKIAEHGRRADGIVKSMLQHSRGGSGERQSVDLNALIEEALNLAYHGARAQDQNFNITLEREFDSAIAPIELVPQDVTRVFLNLIGNGFYAANKRSRETGSRPVLKVTTRDLGSDVEVRIRDNGTGIASENRDKLFQPFFTTKPTGEGTGLGLSISYEIVTQQHGGTIAVDTEVGAFTEFTVRLPRKQHAAPQGRAA